MSDLINDERLSTAIGAGLFRHNFIIRNVQENLGGNFDARIVPRGAFRVLLLFERELGFTFSIMSETNFESLRKRLPDRIHYIEACVSTNTDYDEIEGQMRFDGCKQERDQSVIIRLRDEMMQFDGIINNHFIVLFSCAYNKVTSVRVVLPTPELGIAFKEDWSVYLEKPFYSDNSVINVDLMGDDEEPLVKLKETNNDTAQDNLVALSQEQLASSE
jgi:hypothetical protein